MLVIYLYLVWKCEGKLLYTWEHQPTGFILNTRSRSRYNIFWVLLDLYSTRNFVSSLSQNGQIWEWLIDLHQVTTQILFQLLTTRIRVIWNKYMTFTRDQSWGAGLYFQQKIISISNTIFPSSARDTISHYTVFRHNNSRRVIEFWPFSTRSDDLISIHQDQAN